LQPGQDTYRPRQAQTFWLKTRLKPALQARRLRARPAAWADRRARGRPQATFYGQQQAQDSYADCSLSENYANVNHLPWTTGISTTLALNGVQFGDSAACGLCVMYRGTRPGCRSGPGPGPGSASMGEAYTPQPVGTGCHVHAEHPAVKYAVK